MANKSLETKTFRMEIKELTEEGKFQGYLSVFNNIDAGGDLVEPGAFKRTLRGNKAFPLGWSHSFQEPKQVIGTFHAKEDNFGLLMDGKFFMDQSGGKEAHGVTKQLYEAGVKIGLSIGYKAMQWEMDEKAKQTIRRLKEVQLFEGSLTLFPMNDQALIQAVKDNLQQKPLIITRAQFEKFCPEAAEWMKESGFEQVDLNQVKMPAATLNGLCERVGRGEGFFDRCKRLSWGDIDDTDKYCAWLARQCGCGKETEIEFRCGSCGETVLVIKDSKSDDQALDTSDSVNATPMDDSPNEEEIALLKHLAERMKS
jgi:HK97 family phage prohead protease